MKTFLFVIIALLMAVSAQAATLSWSAPTTYTDTSAIAPADIARIVYTTYYGALSSGPWTTGTTTAAGALSAIVPEPAAGTTRYYTADCTLDGQTSAKAPPVSKTAPFRAPSAPVGLGIN